MCVKGDPAPWGKLCDSVVPTGWTRVSAARHVIHFHRIKGMLLLTLPIQAVFALGRRPRFTVGDSIEWNPECKKMSGTSVINAGNKR